MYETHGRKSSKLININQSQASIKRSRIKVLHSLVDKKKYLQK